jgi:endonuclease/exonuclease/phosphatase (EEP) superfamily protein YafD
MSCSPRPGGNDLTRINRVRLLSLLKRICYGFISLAAIFVSMATVAGFFGLRHWRFELASQFRLQYLLFFIAAGVAFGLGKRYYRMTAAGMLALANLVLIAPLYFGGDHEPGSRSYRAELINLNFINQDYQRVRDFIRASNPDIVMVLEITDVWAQQLSGLSEQYPYYAGAPQKGVSGIALWSRFPIVSHEIIVEEKSRMPTMIATLEVEGRNLTLIGIHPFQPAARIGFILRNRHLDHLGEIASKSGRPLLLLGDLNTTSWSPYFAKLVKAGNLKDSRRGFGLCTSWPNYLPYLGLTIDHALYTDGLAITHRGVGPYVGSDHYPVIVDFAFAAAN